MPRVTVTGILIFKCTEGAGVEDYSLTLMQDGSKGKRKALDLDDLTEK